jgi:aryl-alcohol dehydrogenase-like predicted oxidoreductase
MQFLRISEAYNLPRVATLQNSYHLMNRTIDFGISEILHREQLSLLAYSPLAFGHLSGKYIDDPQANGRVTMFLGYAQRYSKPNVTAASAAYAKLARAHGLTPTQLALSFVMHRWCVASTIIGATNMAQLQENIAAYNVQLSSDVLTQVDQIHLSMTNPAP